VEGAHSLFEVVYTDLVWREGDQGMGRGEDGSRGRGWLIEVRGQWRGKGGIGDERGHHRLQCPERVGSNNSRQHSIWAPVTRPSQRKLHHVPLNRAVNRAVWINTHCSNPLETSTCRLLCRPISSSSPSPPPLPPGHPGCSSASPSRVRSTKYFPGCVAAWHST
jgi:hypothetical protein